MYMLSFSLISAFNNLSVEKFSVTNKNNRWENNNPEKTTTLRALQLQQHMLPTLCLNWTGMYIWGGINSWRFVTTKWEFIYICHVTADSIRKEKKKNYPMVNLPINE